jgi:aminopeptidase-like protein
LTSPDWSRDLASGEAIYAFAKTIFPIHRSITGDGVRQTLSMIADLLPGFQTFEVPSGTKAFDWEVPDEWNIDEAYVEDPSGQRIIDFRDHNLHVVAYSEPVDTVVSLNELQEHLHSLPDRPAAIPFITSYYGRRWGFCLSHNQRQRLVDGNYRVVIKSRLARGHLTYGELLIRGTEPGEVLLSTYVCHPAMGNNETSGMAVTTFLARWLQSQPRRLSYRVLFLPETIGSIVYLSRHLEDMKRRTIAGFQITCVGDDRAFSFVPSRLGGTLADRVARHVLDHHAAGWREYSFLQRASDERQYCYPLVDLPVVSVMRSKYHEYPEYHTSDDDLTLISPAGLGGAFAVLRHCLSALEQNATYLVTMPCEPQLGKRGLYPDLSTGRVGEDVNNILNVLTYCDGRHDLVGIAERVRIPIERCAAIASTLHQHGLIERCAPA